MNGTKFTMNIEIQVMDKESIAGIVTDMQNQFDKGFNEGLLIAQDGDRVQWEITEKKVEF